MIQIPIAFIFDFLQAEAEAKVDKKRDKVERLVLESQEKGFWDSNRPISGAANNNDIDMRKLCRSKRPKKTMARSSSFPITSGPDNNFLWSSVEGVSLSERVTKMQSALERKRVRISKAVESLHAHNELYLEFDMLLVGGSGSGGGGILSGITTSTTSAGTISSSGILNISAPVASQSQGPPSSAPPVTPGFCSPNATQATETTTIVNNGSDITTSALNPWVSDNSDFWINETSLKEVSIRRVKRWSFSIHELLKDPAGREEIHKWLEKEFSAENLNFWEACQVGLE